jgi:toxin ParE1/3/4
VKRYVLSRAAAADLGAIWEYTAETWSADQAERYILSIRDALDALAAGRKLGRSVEDIRPGYSCLAVGSHMIFYRVIEKGSIHVVRILHRRMDFTSRL